MFEKILTARTQPVITPELLAAFGRFDLPEPDGQDYQLLLTMIEAATDEVETMAAQACMLEQVQLTFDYFPGQSDPRMTYELLNYTYLANPWWWMGFIALDSIELVRRPVVIPSLSPVANSLVVTYIDVDGNTQTLDPSIYTVGYDKITLNVGCMWPLTDRKQDCIQISYWAGYSDPTQVPPRLIMAILYLATHMYQVRQIISVEPTSTVGMTLNRMLNSFRSMRVPR